MATLEELQSIADEASVSASIQELESIAAESQPQQRVDISDQTLQVGPFDTGVKLPESLTAGLISAGRGLTTVGRGLGFVDPQSELEKRSFKQLDEEFPIATTIGKVAGEAAPFLVPGAGIGAIGSQAGRIAAATVLGASEGAILSSGRGESLEEAIVDAGIGGLIAGGLEAAFPIIGRLSSALVSRVTGKTPTGNLLDRAGRPTDELKSALNKSGQTFEDLTRKGVRVLEQSPQAIPQQAARAARLESLGIPATSGDVTQDFAQQSAESRLLESPAETSGQIFRELRLSQSRAFRRNLDDIVAKTGIPTESGDSVIEALEGQKTLLRGDKNKLYREFAETSPDVQAVPIITDSIAEALPDSKTLRRLNRLAPSQIGALDDLLVEFGLERSPDKVQSFIASGADIEPLNVGNFEDFRQSLNLIERTDQTGAASVAIGPLRTALDKEGDLLESSLSKGGITDDDVLAPLRQARGVVTELKTEFDPNRLAGKITATKPRSKERKVESSQVFNEIFAAKTPIENVDDLLVTLNKSPDGKKAIADLQASLVTDLIDSSFSTASRKISGELTFNPTGFNKRLSQIGEDKVNALFKGNPKEGDKILQLSAAARDTQPTAGATPKGSASVILDMLNQLGVTNALSRSPVLLGVKSVAKAVKDKGTNEVALRKALSATPEIRETVTFIQNDLPGIAAPLGIAGLSFIEEEE